MHKRKRLYQVFITLVLLFICFAFLSRKATAADNVLPIDCQGNPIKPADGVKELSTAIGCVQVEDLTGPTGFLQFVLKWILGASGGIIVIMVIITGYTLLTSSGNPEKLKAVQENIVGIATGLIFIVFSLFLLKVIGANILGLPGF